MHRALATLLALALASPAAALDLDSIFLRGEHDGPELPTIHWRGDGDGYVVARERDGGGKDFWLHGVATGDSSLWLSVEPPTGEGGEPVEVDGVELAPGGGHVLIATNRRDRWRHSYTADHWVLDSATGERHRLSVAGGELHVAFSPDGSHIGWVKGGDIFVAPAAGGGALRLTRDGGDRIRNGDADWVYEEEFGLLRAWWWSPGGDRIAWLRFELADTPTFPLVEQGDGQYPLLHLLPYPKAGEENSRVGARVLSLEDARAGREPTFVCAPEEGLYLPRLQWGPAGDRVFGSFLDRDQTWLEIRELRCAPPDPNVRLPAPAVLLREEAEAGWVELRDAPHFLAGEGGPPRWLVLSDRSGRTHLYEGTLSRGARTSWRAVTGGNFDVKSLVHVDEAAGRALVLTNRGDHRQQHVEWVDLATGELRRLSGERGWHSAEVAPDGSALVLEGSRRDQRPQLRVLQPDGSFLRWLHRDPMEDLAGQRLGSHRWVELQNDEGDTLFAELFLPPGFREDQPHPVLIYCYGGPGSQRVRDSWMGRRRGLFHLALAQEGHVVFTVDGRGTAGRGRAWEHSVYRRLGQLEAEDQLAGIRWLKRQPFVDPERIALWGWSYGGYLSSQVHFLYPGALAAAIAVAPVSDWRFYDTIYTERFMDQPADNPRGYEQGAPLTHAANLAGPYLLVHGLGDDNVHPQNSLRLATALVEAGRPFEFMLYPDKAHSIDGNATQRDLYGRIRDFLHRHLGVGAEAAPEGSP